MKSYRSQISFLILFAFLLPLAAHADLNPTGKFGDGGKEWDPSWSDTFFKCWQQQRIVDGTESKIETAFKKGLSDVGPGKKWCTAAKLDDNKDIQLMMLSTLKALCKPESSCNPNAVNPNGTNEPAIGLFQIGVEDATKKHHCKDEHGSAITGEGDLKDPKKNLCCAIQIADDVAGGKGSNSTEAGGGKDSGAFATGKTGIMAAFWQPMREGTSSGGGSDGKGSVDNSKNSDAIKTTVNQSCQAIASGGYSAEGNLTSQEFSQASGGSSSPFGSSGGFFGSK
jgi:hypothetical protein